MPKKSLKDRHPEILNQVYDLARRGMTDVQIAETIGVTDRTLDYWKVKDLVFASVLKKNKDLADDVVVKSLYKRATGYDYVERTSSDKGIIEMEKHAPPDPTSMIFWLKNRQPTNWKDKVELQVDPSEILKIIAPDGKSDEFKG